MSDADISTLTTAYTVPAGVEARLTAAFCNRSTSATATVSLWVVPQGETRGNEHLKESGTTLGLAGTSQAVLERSFVAPTGCIVYVQASTANVSCQVAGDVVDLETVTGVTDGTASITWDSTWANFSSGTTLKKNADGFVNLQVYANHSGSGTITVLTLPSGYRPAKDVNTLGTAIISSATWPCIAYVSTAGVVYCIVLGSSIGSPSINSGTKFACNVGFYT
jgi:hypothetical protein